MTAIPVLIPTIMLLSAFLATFSGLWRPKLAYIVSISGTLITLIIASVGLWQVVTSGPISYHLGGWLPPWGIEYVLDNLSAFMCVVILFITLMVLIYPPSTGLYQTPRKGIPLYGLVMLLITGLTGVVVTGDVFNLFVFLEIYSICSYALITLGGNRAVIASFRYLILGTIAGGFYLLGVGFLYFTTGTLNMADMAGILAATPANPAIIAGMALVICALCIKMALFPLHVWLPDAHSYAPPVVAAILASVQVEVAAYALIRLVLSVFSLEYISTALPITDIIAWCAAVGIIVGSVMAITQRDLKRMLAYSTVGQIGYIGLGIGLANPLGLIGALLHILNHAFMKCCLFLVAGGIRKQTGLREIPWFTGIGRRMPLMMAAFSVAALAMIGIPPTAGFFSKWYLVLGSIASGNWTFVAVLLASSLLTAVYFFRIIEKVYTNPTKNANLNQNASEPGPRILAPILVLAFGIIVLGVFNAFIVTKVLAPLADTIFIMGGG
ncbi:monovalent cation/H+ antiporter subunit D family protein [Chloroflexota bacterium]